MHSPAVHRRLEQTEQAFHDLNSRGGLEGNDDQGGTRVASPTARCFHPPSKPPIPHNSPFRWRKGKTSTSCPTRGPEDTNSLPIPQEGQTNKPSFTKTQLQGEIVGNDDQGGTRVASPNSALLSSPPQDRFPTISPFSKAKEKRAQVTFKQREREPTRPCPQYKRHPMAQ
jgi:hypothetical protein